MKKLLMGVGLATVLLASNAFGVTLIQVVGNCGKFNNGSDTNAAVTGSFTCPTAAALGITGTITGEFVVYDSDFSNPDTLTETAVTNWAFTASPLSGIAFGADTTTSTEGTGAGSGTSTTATSSMGNAFQAAVLDSFGNLIKAGFDNTVSTPFGTVTANYTNQSTVGTAVGLTGYLQVVYQGSNLVVGTPEPISMVLFGSGLIAISVLRRRKSS